MFYNGAFYTSPEDELYISGNTMNIWKKTQSFEGYYDLQLMSGTDFCRWNDINNTIVGTLRTERHPFAEVNYDHTEDDLVDYMVSNAGAFPRDPMDRRLMEWVRQRAIDPTHWSEKGMDYSTRQQADDAFLFDWTTPPVPYLDSDDDGMPDDWEICNGLDPMTQDHTGKELSLAYTGVEGYDNLEVYLNRLSDHLVNGVSLTAGTCMTYPVDVTANVSQGTVTAGQDTEVTFTVEVSSSQNVQKVELNLDVLSAPYAWPSPEPVDITSSGSNNIFTYTYTVPAERDPGNYSVSVHVENSNGEDGYAVIPIVVQN